MAQQKQREWAAYRPLLSKERTELFVNPEKDPRNGFLRDRSANRHQFEQKNGIHMRHSKNMASEIQFQIGKKPFVTIGNYRSMNRLESYDLHEPLVLSEIRLRDNAPDFLTMTMTRWSFVPQMIEIQIGGSYEISFPLGPVACSQRVRIPLSAEAKEALQEGFLRLRVPVVEGGVAWIAAPNQTYPRLGLGFCSHDEPNDYLGRLKDSAIQQFGWMHGCALDALYALSERTGELSYREAIDFQLERFLTVDGLNYEAPNDTVVINGFPSIEELLPMAIIARLHPQHPSIDQALNHINEQRETDPRSDTFGLISDRWMMTTEGLYTIAYPLMVIGRLRDDVDLIEEAWRQIYLRKNRLWTNRTICAYQGVYKDGTSPDFIPGTYWAAPRTINWTRGVCWYLLGLIRTQIASEEEPTPEIAEHLRDLAAWVVSFQEPCGLWRNYLDDPAQEYETSGSAGVAAFLALAARHGWIDASYRKNAERCLEGLQSYLVDAGFLDYVGASDKSKTYPACIPFGLGLMGQLHEALL